MNKRKAIHLIFLFIIFTCFAGCSRIAKTFSKDIPSLTEDHSIGLIAKPISGTGTLIWRLKTFTEESLRRLHLRLVKFPVLTEKKPPPIDPHRRYMDPAIMDLWLEQRVGKRLYGNINIYVNGENFFPKLEQIISQASRSIKISTYIFDNDRYAFRFANLLKEKSDDASIKIISDFIASSNAWITSERIAKKERVVSTNIFKYMTKDTDIQVRRSRNIWFSSEHSKMIIIDGNRAFFGGMNIGDEYRFNWRDVMFEVNGELAYAFERYFNSAWIRSDHFSNLKFYIKKLANKRKNQKMQDAVPCHILKTTPVIHQIYDSQLRALKNSSHHVYVENPYLWNENFIYELCAARKRGVDVRVTLPDSFDYKALSGINIKVVNILMAHGVRVFIHPGMTHVKAAVYDGWACFGTANYDDLSFHKNYEINLGTSHAHMVKKIEQEILVSGQKISHELRLPPRISPMDIFTYELKDYL